ncbi:MAG: glycosyltransferase [Snowella sp.]|nr:glycosyltransferase [Snowella sp.]
MASISVIIPNFNREKLVGETIQNMLDQSLAPSEVIVVDDGSTDNSIEVIKAFGDRVRLIQQENQGPGAARNAGLKVATGKYIQFMDSDDLASLNKLEIQAQALNQYQADMVYSPWTKVYIENKTLRFQDHILQKQALPQKLSILEWFLSGWSIVLQSCLFRREFLLRTAPFRHDLMVWEDGEYMVRLFTLHPKIIFAPSCLTLYRLHNFQKLTESGTSDGRRLQDRISTSLQFWELLNQIHQPLKPFVRLNFGFECWSMLKAMEQFTGFSEEEKRNLEKLSNFYPAIFWHLFSYFRRAMIRLRWQTTGSRWIYPYQSAFPTQGDYQLVKLMGFEVER